MARVAAVASSHACFIGSSCNLQPKLPLDRGRMCLTPCDHTRSLEKYSKSRFDFQFMTVTVSLHLFLYNFLGRPPQDGMQKCSGMMVQQGSLPLSFNFASLQFLGTATGRERIIGERNLRCHGNGWDEYVRRNLV
jgi:transposase